MDLNEKQQAFLRYYTDPKSDTWSNYRQSALKAGYSEEYADNISSLMPNWLSENIGDTKLLVKATKNLEMGLDGLLDDPEKGGKPIQAKLTEFTLKGLQKSKWSDRQEVTGKDGKDLIPEVLTEEQKQALQNLVK